MIEDLRIEEDGIEDHDIPISNEEVTGEVFKKALAWMEKNRGKVWKSMKICMYLVINKIDIVYYEDVIFLVKKLR